MDVEATIGWRVESEYLVLSIKGTINFDNADSVRQDIRAIIAKAQQCQRAAVDMSGVRYLDSAGLGAFVGLKLDLKTYERFVIFGLSEPVSEMFSTSRMNRILDVVDTWEDVINETVL
jgi:anti-anti-sigma factor